MQQLWGVVRREVDCAFKKNDFLSRFYIELCWTTRRGGRYSFALFCSVAVVYRCCIFVVGMRQDKWAQREASRPKLKGIWGSKVRPTFGRALCEIEYNHLVEHIAAVFFLFQFVPTNYTKCLQLITSWYIFTMKLCLYIIAPNHW